DPQVRVRTPGRRVRPERGQLPAAHALRQEAAARFAPAIADRSARGPRELSPGGAAPHAADAEGGVRRLLQPRPRLRDRGRLGPPANQLAGTTTPPRRALIASRSLNAPRCSGGRSSAIATMIASDASSCVTFVPSLRLVASVNGLPKVIFTGTRRGQRAPFGRHSRVPVSATGSTGQPVFWAMNPAPGSGVASSPDSTRVPSG